jgi:hypothetical protein
VQETTPIVRSESRYFQKQRARQGSRVARSSHPGVISHFRLRHFSTPSTNAELHVQDFYFNP